MGSVPLVGGDGRLGQAGIGRIENERPLFHRPQGDLEQPAVPNDDEPVGQRIVASRAGGKQEAEEPEQPHGQARAVIFGLKGILRHNNKEER